MKRLIITLCLALGSFVVGCSDDFQRGVEAYNKGDYSTALKEWTPLANLRNVNAPVSYTHLRAHETDS